MKPLPRLALASAPLLLTLAACAPHHEEGRCVFREDEALGPNALLNIMEAANNRHIGGFEFTDQSSGMADRRARGAGN